VLFIIIIFGTLSFSVSVIRICCDIVDGRTTVSNNKLMLAVLTVATERSAIKRNSVSFLRPQARTADTRRL